MNFLFHLYLSGDDPDLLVGNLMGDFVKGRLSGRFPPGIEQGVALHRRIDSGANRSPAFVRSRGRLDPSIGLYRGVLVDLFYDHFLIVAWQAYHPEPLEQFLDRAYRLARDREAFLPERLRQILGTIFTDLIPSYREATGIVRALERMSGRIARPNPLAWGGRELELHYAGLRDDFEQFLPAIREQAADWRAGR
jgi:acyl carrier protein phosphodiesterase